MVKRYGFIERSKLWIKSQLKMKIFYSVKYLIFCIILQSAMMLSCLKVMTILFISIEISRQMTEAKVGVLGGNWALQWGWWWCCFCARVGSPPPAGEEICWSSFEHLKQHWRTQRQAPVYHGQKRSKQERGKHKHGPSCRLSFLLY